MNTPDPEAVLAALCQHGHHPVHLETDVLALFTLTGALQLALRHPHLSDSSRTIIAGAMDLWIAAMESLHPAIAAGMRLGLDPVYDVPMVDVPIGHCVQCDAPVFLEDCGDCPHCNAPWQGETL